jgi:hypothetical protein
VKGQAEQQVTVNSSSDQPKNCPKSVHRQSPAIFHSVRAQYPQCPPALSGYQAMPDLKFFQLDTYLNARRKIIAVGPFPTIDF